MSVPILNLTFSHRNVIVITLLLYFGGLCGGCGQMRKKTIEYEHARFVLGYVDDHNRHPVKNRKYSVKGEPNINDLLEKLGLAESTTIINSRRSGIGKNMPIGVTPTTVVLIRSIPNIPLELPQATEGVAVYLENEGKFDLVTSNCKFGSKKIKIQAYDDGMGNDGITYEFTAGLSKAGASVPILWAK